jgi:hypothetical protein
MLFLGHLTSVGKQGFRDTQSVISHQVTLEATGASFDTLTAARSPNAASAASS